MGPGSVTSVTSVTPLSLVLTEALLHKRRPRTLETIHNATCFDLIEVDLCRVAKL